ASVALKVRGKIFAMTIGADLVLKLPRERVDRLVDDGAGTRFDPRKDGRVMKEWAVVPPGGAPWPRLAAEAHRFVAGGRRRPPPSPPPRPPAPRRGTLTRH